MSFDPVSAFQFHEGPIKTVITKVLVKLFLSFNSMKVRLKRRPACMLSRNRRCFNSMKVRLKRADEWRVASADGVSIP